MTLSVIIPTLNEEKHILKTLAVLRTHAVNHVEVVVVDAGSEDNSVMTVLEHSKERVHVDENLRGRKYESLNTGAHITSGDVLLFLDADTLLPERFDALILEAIQSGAVGGAFNMKFDRTPFSLGLIRFFNALRYRFTKHFFGDQAVFCTRDAFLKVGGFPSSTLMETAHFSASLKKKGKLKLINESVITSSRRFLEGGVLRVFWFDLRVYLKDLLRLGVEKEGEVYWGENAKVSPSQDDKS
jgi:rSAM/selenodomain-associated transferase 2